MSQSNLLRWSYRLGLMGAGFGFLAGLNIVYVDFVDGQLERAESAAALGLSSIVLAVSLILGRRLRRRSKELARRLDKLEHNDHQLVRFALALPNDIESRILKHLQSSEKPAGVQHDNPPAPDALHESSDMLALALQLLGGSPGEEEIDAEVWAKRLRDYQALIDRLRAEGLPHHADRIADRLTILKRRIQSQLREQLVEALRQQRWLLSLEIGESFERIFPGSVMAREFSALAPRIIRKLQEVVPAAQRTPSDGSSRLKLADQVSKTA